LKWQWTDGNIPLVRDDNELRRIARKTYVTAVFTVPSVHAHTFSIVRNHLFVLMTQTSITCGLMVKVTLMIF